METEKPILSVLKAWKDAVDNAPKVTITMPDGSEWTAVLLSAEEIAEESKPSEVMLIYIKYDYSLEVK